MSDSETTPLLPTEKMVFGGSASPATASRERLPISRESFPDPTVTRAKRQKGRPKLPQCIAHRGYKAKYPENTMTAFEAAIEEAGAHAIETDIHLSKDGRVVLSHDPDLRRCFGRRERIIDCNWSFLKTLRTTHAPYSPMPLLTDLLSYISRPEHQNVWILLDIKLDNNAENVIRLIAEAIRQVPPNSADPDNTSDDPWKKRVVLGIWAAKYLPLCVKYLPTYPVVYIGFCTHYASKFLAIPNIGFNMNHKLMIGPIGNTFIRKVQRANRPLFLWTVNDVTIMKWCIQKGIDGVITDDPLRYNRLCDSWTGQEAEARPTVKQWLFAFWLNIIVLVFSIPLKHRFAGNVEGFVRSEQLRVRASLVLGA